MKLYIDKRSDSGSSMIMENITKSLHSGNSFMEANTFPAIVMKLVGGFVGSKSLVREPNFFMARFPQFGYSIGSSDLPTKIKKHILDSLCNTAPKCFSQPDSVSDSLIKCVEAPPPDTQANSVNHTCSFNLSPFNFKPLSENKNQSSANITFYKTMPVKQSYAEVAKLLSHHTPQFYQKKCIQEAEDMKKTQKESALVSCPNWRAEPRHLDYQFRHFRKLENHQCQHKQNQTKISNGTYTGKFNSHPFKNECDLSPSKGTIQPGTSPHLPTKRKMYNGDNYFNTPIRRRTKRNSHSYDISQANSSECKNWRCRHPDNCLEKLPSKYSIKSPNNEASSELKDHSCALTERVPNLNMTPCKSNHSEANTSHREEGKAPHIRSRKLSEASDTSASEIHDSLSECSFVDDNSNTIKVSGSRQRHMSECSVESEDSFIVFKPDCDYEDSDFIESASNEDSDDSFDDTDDDSDDDSEEEPDYVASTHDEVDFTCGCPDLLAVNKKWKEQTRDICDKTKKPNKVRFSDSNLKTVHEMCAWNFAYRQARRGPWEQLARDRNRFTDRVKDLKDVLEPVLQPEHRQKVWDRLQRLAK